MEAEPDFILDKKPPTYDSYGSFLELAEERRLGRRNYQMGDWTLPDYDTIIFSVDGRENEVQIHPDRIKKFEAEMRTMFGERFKLID